MPAQPISDNRRDGGAVDTASGAVWDGSDVQKSSNVDMIW